MRGSFRVFEPRNVPSILHCRGHSVRGNFEAEEWFRSFHVPVPWNLFEFINGADAGKVFCCEAGCYSLKCQHIRLCSASLSVSLGYISLFLSFSVCLSVCLSL